MNKYWNYTIFAAIVAVIISILSFMFFEGVLWVTKIMLGLTFLMFCLLIIVDGGRFMPKKKKKEESKNKLEQDVPFGDSGKVIPKTKSAGKDYNKKIKPEFVNEEITDKDHLLMEISSLNRDLERIKEKINIKNKVYIDLLMEEQNNGNNSN